ncbi:MAG: hypothetical protein FJ320_00115 [SAR202 cluster bacterium]|nr:hypothetical protein [SAR202 cluster bacterium]
MWNRFDSLPFVNRRVWKLTIDGRSEGFENADMSRGPKRTRRRKNSGWRNIMSKLLYIATHGTDDPTRATFPFLMAKGAIEAGHETGIILMGEAAPLIKDKMSSQIQGIGVPPLKELMEFLVKRNVRISV